MTETDLMNAIRLKLSEYGIVTFRTNVGKVRTADGRWFDTGLPPGFSDLMAIKDGKVFFLEVKVKPNRATENQLAFLERMKSKGCRGGVVYSIEDALKVCDVCKSATLGG